jgi:hypothetical protein
MIQKNVFKWSIGGHSTTQTGISRMMMTVYNPLSDADAFGSKTGQKSAGARLRAAGGEIVGDEQKAAAAPAAPSGCDRSRIKPAISFGHAPTSEVDACRRAASSRWLACDVGKDRRKSFGIRISRDAENCGVVSRDFGDPAHVRCDHRALGSQGLQLGQAQSFVGAR